MARHTVDEAEMLDTIEVLHEFRHAVTQRLNEVADGLIALQRWEGPTFVPAIHDVRQWQLWALTEMNREVGQMERNLRTAYNNYLQTAKANARMWGGG
ncbi:WXG100 family type VII secretion target [Mycolicibacter longobardus]|uniref:Uncharacterized protein n=1 Tax=Mycolicibacter longobardus TaxID=1108812 RepID=A0A1X1YMY0_9MYCO|nr:hypothetical protein [Mycolicibacter longobardus]ORW12479.1 hypothetical protein AWC16_08800 [Mycolicibacter longobardus]